MEREKYRTERQRERQTVSIFMLKGRDLKRSLTFQTPLPKATGTRYLGTQKVPIGKKQGLTSLEDTVNTEAIGLFST
jgi:predicted secreted Zn-dependent protease